MWDVELLSVELRQCVLEQNAELVTRAWVCSIVFKHIPTCATDQHLRVHVDLITVFFEVVRLRSVCDIDLANSAGRQYLEYLVRHQRRSRWHLHWQSAYRWIGVGNIAHVHPCERHRLIAVLPKH